MSPTKNKNKNSVKRIVFAILAAELMLLTGFPIDLLITVGVCGGEEEPTPAKSIHIWDFGIKQNNKNNYWRYQATTDLYKVRFPKEINKKSANITTSKNKHPLEMSIINITCHDYVGIKKGSSLFERPNKVKPVVKGTTIIYPGVYTNISLMYEICFHQCKEGFVIKAMPTGILDDLMFNTKVKFNTSQLSVYVDGKHINKTYYGMGNDIEFRDNNGTFVYRIPIPDTYTGYI